MNQAHHEMILEMTHASGMQGWFCPICGRRILLLVPPDGDMVIVETGDQTVGHSGSSGGLRISSVEVTQSEKYNGEISEESLRPWIKAIEDLDIDW